MRLAHWGTRALHKNLDETVYDLGHPQAFPAQRSTDLMGRLRVRLRAEDHAIVAYGFGGQRIEIPSSEIGAVRTVRAYRTGAALAFQAYGQNWQDTDPSIGGRPLPLDSGDPMDTHEPVTVVYDRSDPNTAAALRQITGSVWHGAPTANVIVGIIFTLALPLLSWHVVVRLRRRKWLRNAEIFDDFVGLRG
jgi:hypothetical protein